MTSSLNWESYNFLPAQRTAIGKIETFNENNVLLLGHLTALFVLLFVPVFFNNENRGKQ